MYDNPFTLDDLQPGCQLEIFRNIQGNKKTRPKTPMPTVWVRYIGPGHDVGEILVDDLPPYTCGGYYIKLNRIKRIKYREEFSPEDTHALSISESQERLRQIIRQLKNK